MDQTIPDRSPNGLQVRAGQSTWLLAAAVVVVTATAVATTTTDLAVAGELTVLTEVAARTTGELGGPVPEPASAMSDQQKREIAHHEFDR